MMKCLALFLKSCFGIINSMEGQCTRLIVLHASGTQGQLIHVYWINIRLGSTRKVTQRNPWQVRWWRHRLKCVWDPRCHGPAGTPPLAGPVSKQHARCAVGVEGNVGTQIYGMVLKSGVRTKKSYSVPICHDSAFRTLLKSPHHCGPELPYFVNKRNAIWGHFSSKILRFS